MRYFVDKIPAKESKDFFALCDMVSKYIDNRTMVRQDYLVPISDLPEFKRLVKKFLKPDLTYRYRYRGTRNHSPMRLDTLKENATGAAFIIHYRDGYKDLDFQNKRHYLIIKSKLDKVP